MPTATKKKSPNNRERQYEHIKESIMKRGGKEHDAKRIAGATVQKTRRQKGETKGTAKGPAKGSARTKKSK